jgi:hypothetical protein
LIRSRIHRSRDKIAQRCTVTRPSEKGNMASPSLSSIEIRAAPVWAVVAIAGRASLARRASGFLSGLGRLNISASQNASGKKKFSITIGLATDQPFYHLGGHLYLVETPIF